MFEFRITGFRECPDQYYYDRGTPIDITVRADSQSDAIQKAELVLGYKIHYHGRRVVIKEV